MNLVDEIIREAKKSILTLTIDDGPRTIFLAYDPEFKVLNTTIMVPFQPKKGVTGEQEARLVLSKVSKEAMEKTLNDIKADNKRYYVAKLRLIKMALENFDDVEVIKIIRVLDIVCVPYRYAGMGNRCHINEYTQLRLCDETRWNDKKEELHLQKVITNVDDCMKTHFYPEETEIELLKEIARL